MQYITKSVSAYSGHLVMNAAEKAKLCRQTSGTRSSETSKFKMSPKALTNTQFYHNI